MRGIVIDPGAKPELYRLPTRHYKGRWFYGRLCIVGWHKTSMTDLPKPLAEELLQKFTPVEVTL